MVLEPNKIDKEKRFEKDSKESAFKKEILKKIPEKPIEEERKIEIRKEEVREEEKPAIKEKEIGVRPVVRPSVPSAALPKSPARRKIEIILEEDLGRVYRTMTPEQKRLFKEEGEKTASKIEILINKIKVKTKEILNLIRSWLKLIPGINKFFLEQEAKIKTNKILKIKEDRAQLEDKEKKGV